MDIPRKTWDEQFNNQLQICKVVWTIVNKVDK